MTIKTYGQACEIAIALDCVGDRWTLLILRDLAECDLRFTDLRDKLPGIASNLLTTRLRDLEDGGLVARREIPSPVPRTVYGLTETGLRIVPTLRSLAEFGRQLTVNGASGTRRNLH